MPGSGAPNRDEVSLDEKVGFLRQPSVYPEAPSAVETEQTHMSWVFLTDRHAYKIKKPVHYGHLDYSTLAKRESNCRAELRLNKRLAAPVYREILPLTWDPDRGLAVDGGGRPVEWIVKMRRLPKDHLLDHRIPKGTASSERISRFIDHLVGFYESQPPELFAPSGYIHKLRLRLQETARQLRPWVKGARLAELEKNLNRLLERHREPADARGRDGRVVDGHGDLRPQHVYVNDEAYIIDCIEFDRDMRLLDPAEELSFLAMECQVLGFRNIGDEILASYRIRSEDPVPDALVRFYKSLRAMVRTRLSLAHLDDHPDDPDKWRRIGELYLQAAEEEATHR